MSDDQEIIDKVIDAYFGPERAKALRLGLKMADSGWPASLDGVVRRGLGEALELLAAIAADESKPENVRAFAREILVAGKNHALSPGRRQADASAPMREP